VAPAPFHGRPDPSDPGARAAERLRLRRERRFRWRGGLAVALPLVAAALLPLAGAAGAAALLMFFLLFLVPLSVIAATRVWPRDWNDFELEEYLLEAIWQELRGDADETVPWARFAAWAEADSEKIDLQLLRFASDLEPADEPWFSRIPVRTFTVDEKEEATEAMESLKVEAERREREARERYELTLLEEEQRQHEERLAAMERLVEYHKAELERQLEEDEARAQRERADQDASMRRTEAEAVARALRRP
jgi:hypothetical protein